MSFISNGAARVRDLVDQNHWPAVEVDGGRLGPEVSDLIVGVEVDSAMNRPDLCTVRLHPSLSEESLPTAFTVGQALDVKAGSDRTVMFQGEITAIQYEHFAGLDTITVTACDKRHRLYRGEQSRAFLNVTYGDVVSQLLQNSRLTGQIKGLPGGVHPYLLQVNRSDGDYLEAILGEVGAIMLMVGPAEVWVGPIAELNEPAVQRLDFRSEVDRFSFRSTSAGDHSEVSVYGWDPIHKERVEGDAQATGHRLTAPTAAQKVAGKFGAGTKLVSTRDVSSVDQAQALAGAISSGRLDGAVQLEASALGNEKLRAGKLITVDGVVKEFQGDYRLSSVRHLFDEGSFRTEFSSHGTGDHTTPGLLQQAVQSGGPGGGPSDRVYGVVTAIVTNLQDPEDLGRVMVKFPWLPGDGGNDIESTWVRVAAVGGGAERGFFVLPEVNDEVLVAFERGDVRRGYILGGLYNGKDPAPGKTSDLSGRGEVDRRVIRSRLGHQLVLNDSANAPAVELVTQSGTLTVLLDDKSTLLKLQSGKDIEIDGSGNIKISGGAEIEIKAGSNLKLSGANVTVEASANLNLKGATVKVDGSGTTEVKGGATTKISGAMVSVSGSGMAEVKAPMVKIN